MKKLLPVLVISALLIPFGFAFADPTLSATPDITAEATSSAGAYVNFTVTATDATDKTDAVTCTPSSGSLFALGTTSVACTSSDSSFSTTTAAFNVIVRDTIPPTITPPPDQSFATSTFPAFPTLVPATATDLVDPSPTITYNPTSFPVGTTTVTWTATDSSANSAATTSQVIITDDSATSTATTSPISFTAATHQFIATSSFSVMPASAYPTVSDTVASSTTIIYSPSSLSTGTTTVTWTASDSLDNTATTSSPVIVIAPTEVDVPQNCTVTDTSGGSDSFPTDASSTNYLGICMLEAAKEAGLISDFQAATSSFGLYIQSINGIQPDATQYWTVWDNEVYSQNGIDDITLSQGDILSFVLTDFNTNAESAAIALQAQSLIAATSSNSSNPPTSNGGTGGGGGGGGGGILHSTFNIPAALAYLSSKQAANGSYDTSDITDWAAVAFAAENPGAALSSIKEYELSAAPAMTSITDYERHAMALEALGINPYDGTSVNYIAPIVASFDGTQIGDPSEDNDDIFGLLVLEHAGYSPADPLITQDAAYLLTKQQPDGSWDESPDLTAAAIDALGPLLTTPQSAAALGEGVGYLMSQQQTNGGWSSIDSTSWVQTAINGIIAEQTPSFSSESAFAAPSGYYPTDALAQAQQQDGAVQPVSDPVDTRVWSTSYAVVAASGKDWQALLGAFSAPSGTNGGGGAAVTVSATSTATTTTATSTAATSTSETATTTVATSSPQTATTTVPVPITPRIGTIVRAAAITLAPSAPVPTQQTVATPTSATATPAVLGAATSSQLAGAAASTGGFSGWQRVFAILAMIFALALAGFAFFPRRFA